MAVENIEIETYFGKCKCCLNYGYLRTMWEQHIVEGDEEIYGEMLMQCFCIEWRVETSEEDDQICEDCIWKLREAHTFKKQVLRCQKQIEQSVVENITEMNSNPDNENYDVEYLDEDILDNPYQNADDSDGESCSGKKRHSKKESRDEDDNDAFNDEDESDYVDYDVNQNSLDEDDEEFTPAPRKRRSPQKGEDTDSGTDGPKPKWPKKLPKEERWKTYSQYSEDALKDAVNAVTSKRMSQKLAAKHYHVPRKTLSSKVRAIKNDAESSQRPKSQNSRESQETLQEDVMMIIKKHRQNVHSVLAYSNATPIRYWGTGYVCALCPELFTGPAALKTHTQSHKNIAERYTVAHVRTHVTRLDVTDLKCLICSTKIEDLLSLMQHLKEHGKPMHFDINNHMVPFKFNTETLECVECGKQFKHFKFLTEHMANMHYRNYVCAKCDRGFICKVNLLSHEDTHKSGQFNCGYCEKIFNSRRKKTTHERLNHALQTKTIQCRYCRMRFESTSQKDNHESTSHKKKRILFNCNACDNSYATHRSLRIHIKKQHLLQRPYKCSKEGCDKSFYLNRALQAHILTHDVARPFSCKLCSNTYRSQKSLKEHMYKHNLKKEFKCPKCYKSYVLEENLTKHLRDKH